MSSKELFFLIMLYLTDPHAKGTKEFKQMHASTLLKKLQDLRYRLDYLELSQIKYGLQHLEQTGKVTQGYASRYKIAA